jgi:guanine nucleotide-binding protein G(i) subunit alpha
VGYDWWEISIGCKKKYKLGPKQRMGEKLSKPETIEIIESTEKKNNKFILVGTEESGKTSVFKQLKKFYQDDPYTEKELLLYKNVIYSNVFLSTRILLNDCVEKNPKDPFDDPENLKNVEVIAEIDGLSILLDGQKYYSTEIHKMIGELWKENLLIEKFQNHSEDFHIFDNLQYFLDRLEMLTPPDYIPSMDDILHCRRKTSGFMRLNFTDDNVDFCISDLGGSRSSRKSWIKSNYYNFLNLGFPGITGIVFVASLSEFNQKCTDDDVTNRMLESMKVFEELTSNYNFKEIPILLLLNKYDIFTQKICKKDLSCVFPEYIGGKDVDAALKFIKEKYQQLVKENPERLQLQVINAMDEDSVMKAFKSFQNQIMERFEKY